MGLKLLMKKGSLRQSMIFYCEWPMYPFFGTINYSLQENSMTAQTCYLIFFTPQSRHMHEMWRKICRTGTSQRPHVQVSR